MDLGVSSPQLDDASRGFSFMRDGPLDMRMDSTQGLSAAEWLAEAKESEIAKVLKEYGEERFSKRIARAIVSARGETEITTTAQLASLVSAAVPVKEKDKHPATRSFQAIRIFINGELDDLRACLDQVVGVRVVLAEAAAGAGLERVVGRVDGVVGAVAQLDVESVDRGADERPLLEGRLEGSHHPLEVGEVAVQVRAEDAPAAGGEPQDLAVARALRYSGKIRVVT